MGTKNDSLSDIKFPGGQNSSASALRFKAIDFDAAISKLENESLESTQRILSNLEEANEKGLRSLTMLEEQDERLHRVECELTEIDGEMNLVKTELRKMERFCGLLKLPSMCLQRFRQTDKDNAFPSADVYLPTSTTTVVSASTTSLSEKKSLDQFRLFTVANSISVKKKKSDGKRNSVFESLTGSAVEKELNANLDEVNAMLGTLKHLAVDINVDLSVQLPMIDHITHLVNDNEREIGTSNQRVNRLT